MRVFHSLVFDENVEGTTEVYTDPVWNPQLGLPDKLTIFAVTDTAAGTSPTLTVRIEESGDQVHWMTKNGAAGEIQTAPMSLTSNSIMVGRDAGTNPTAGFVRLRITLGGAGSPKGHVRLFVTGRGEQVV